MLKFYIYFYVLHCMILCLYYMILFFCKKKPGASDQPKMVEYRIIVEIFEK